MELKSTLMFLIVIGTGAAGDDSALLEVVLLDSGCSAFDDVLDCGGALALLDGLSLP